jgi:hypothetical protein
LNTDANGWNADANFNLSLRHWRQGQASEQRCTTEKNFESAHL